MTGLLDTRKRSILNQFFVVMATLLLGSALHVSVVTGQVGLTSPAVVLRTLVGVACAAVGYRLRVKPDRESPLEREAEADETEAETEEFDPEASPLEPSDFEGMEGDDG